MRCCFRWAVVAVLSGGHSPMCMPDGAFLINLRKMNKVVADPAIAKNLRAMSEAPRRATELIVGARFQRESAIEFLC